MNNTALNIPLENLRYKALIGTGGIGSGSLFLIKGNHTLGREESRSGKYLDARDYCKLHIIAHNVKVILGENFPVYPVGKVGDDNIGRSIYHEMEQAGLNMEYVRYSANDRTLFGFCFLYPDGTGGNLTTDESACNKVDTPFIETVTPCFSRYEGNFITLAAPEVPLVARKRLLELTREYKGFSTASFTSGEMAEAEEKEMLHLIDLLAINIEEASSLVGSDNEGNPEVIVEKVIKKMMLLNPSVWISVTAGIKGSWSWDGRKLTHVPVFPVEIKSTAGAGDAHLAGVIAGLTVGLELHQAQVIGNLAGAFSATSQHTIHPELSPKTLKEFAFIYSDTNAPDLLKLL